MAFHEWRVLRTNWAEVVTPRVEPDTTSAARHHHGCSGNIDDPRHAGRTHGSRKPIRLRKESTTVDIGDCQHADSNQRQLMADAVLGGRRHGQKSSRGFGRTLIQRTRPVTRRRSRRPSRGDEALPSEQPGDDNQHQQRDERQRYPRPWHYCPSFVVVEAPAVDSASRAARASRPSRRRTTARRRSNTRASRNAVGTMTSSTTIACGTNGRPVTHSSTPSHQRATGSTLAA